MSDERLVLSIKECQEKLGLSRSLVYELARTGKLPVIKCGRRILVPKKALEEMLANPKTPAGK